MKIDHLYIDWHPTTHCRFVKLIIFMIVGVDMFSLFDLGVASNSLEWLYPGLVECPLVYISGQFSFCAHFNEGSSIIVKTSRLSQLRETVTCWSKYTLLIWIRTN